MTEARSQADRSADTRLPEEPTRSVLEPTVVYRECRDERYSAAGTFCTG